MGKQSSRGARAGGAAVLVLVSAANIGYGIVRHLDGKDGNLPLFVVGLVGAGMALLLMITAPKA